MKMTSTQSLCLFLISLILFCSYSNSVETESLMKVPLKGYYYVQRMYPGNDPIDNIKESEFHTKRVFFEVNDEIIFFRENESKKEDIEDSISLVDLFDNTLDNADDGKCCQRITYEVFPAGNSLRTIIPAIPSNVKGKAAIDKANSKGNTVACSNDANNVNPVMAPSKSKNAEKKSKNPEKNANYCLLLHVPEEARWRICSDSQQQISTLHLKIVYTILKIKSKVKNGIMDKFINKIKVGSVEDIGNWTWDNQDKWQGKCQGTTMQSPINILDNKSIKPDGKFSVSLHLTDVHTLIKKNFKEIIVTFMKFGGVLKLNFENTYILYTPQYMSFRFPGEGMVNGQRSDGDILLHFAELSSERKTATSAGLILVIPLEATFDGPNLSNLDDLNMEFWKYEVLKHGTYTPKKFFKKKLIKFGLEEFSNRFMALNPNFYMYYGSNTTPPCTENVVWIVVDKPLQIPGCQFKLLRENSLMTSKPKEIHTRLEKPTSDRPVYKFDQTKFSYIASIIGLVPMSFNKYLMLYGPSYMARLFFKYGANGKGGRYLKWFKKHGKNFKFHLALKGRGATPWWLGGKGGRGGLIGKIPDGVLDEIDCSVEKPNGTEEPQK